MATHPRDHRSASAVTRDVLVELSLRPHPPTLPEVKAAVRRHIPDRSSIPSQVLAQRVSGLVATYLRIAPRPIGCTFRPTTLTGSSARQLLTWQDPHGRVTVDLVWTSLSHRPAALQAALLALVEDGSQVLGQDLQAVRVIDAVRQTVEVHPVVWRRAA